MPANSDERVVATRVQSQLADSLIALPRDHALRRDRAVVEKTAYPFDDAVSRYLGHLGIKTLEKRSVDVEVKDGEVVIVDEFTGRLMPGRLRAMLDLLPDALPRAQPLPETFPADGPRRADQTVRDRRCRLLQLDVRRGIQRWRDVVRRE